MGLNKVYENPLLWETPNFAVIATDDRLGYHIQNLNTGVVEMFLEQEGSAVMAIQSLEEAYVEVMKDPVREYTVRKQRQEAMRVPAHAPAKSGPQLVN